MIARLWLMTGCIALILPAALCAQPGGGRGNFGGGRGNFGGGGFGGGGFGGGGSGFSRGGFSGRGMGDPDQIFNMFSQGKDFIDLNSMDDFRRSGMERMMQRFNITAKDGKITREDFRAASEKMRSAMGGGGRPGRGADGPPSTDSEAEAEFNKLDRDHDGQLSAEEMTGPFGESLLAERDKWDTNQDKFIDLPEFKSFYAARMQQQKNDRGKDGSAREDRNSRDKQDLDRRPVVVYRAGNLPKEVAALFAKYDTDQDAQISLYEWRMGGGDIEEFKKMDRSGDNLLTVEEALLYVRLEKMSSSVASSGDSGNKPDNGVPGAVNFNMGGPAAFGDRQNGGRSPWGNGNWQGNGGGNWQGNGGGNWPGAGGANGFGGRSRNRGNFGGGGRNKGGDYGGGGE